MAQINFPALPAVGDLFSVAGTGVTYRWNGQQWLTQAGPGGGTGDFYATGAGGAINTGAPTTIVVPTVISGNATGSYSVSTGRYTPPAGRYNIFGSLDGTAGGGTAGIFVYVFKNGTQIANAVGGTYTAAGQSATPAMSVIADANGSDYFELRGFATAAASIAAVGFGGFPLTGMQGPQGAPPTAGTLTAQSILLSYSGATFGLSNISSGLNWDTITENTTGGTYSAPNFTVPAGMAGLWDVNIQVQGVNAAANIIMAVQLYVGGAQIANASTFCGSSLTGTTVLNGKFRLAAGDTVRTQANQSTTSGTAYGTSGGVRSSWMHLTRVGA